MRILLLPPMFMAPLAVYEAMSEHDLVVIDTARRYDKRFKAAHRTVICDAHGPLTLTVPVTRPHGVDRPTWADVTVSAHNEWWRSMSGAITTAYSPLPFFMHLWAEISPYITEQTVGMSVVDLDTRLDATLRRLLDIKTPASTVLPPGTHQITTLADLPEASASILARLFAGE